MKFQHCFPFALLALAGCAAFAAPPAQTDSQRLTPFAEFRDSLRTADSATYMQRADARVADAPAFEEMRQHLLSLYEGENVRNSFEAGGDVMDCVPIMEQPSVRLNGITEIATPPEPTKMDAGDPSEAAKSIVPWVETEKDAFDNQRSCAGGTVPIRRVTLEEITRFSSLKSFLQKSPDGEDEAPGFEPPGGVTHKYSHATQSVNNWGGNGYLNIWDPAINTAKSEIFSLTQHWYVGGSGTTLPGLQTVELGWQVFPAKYGNTQPAVLTVGIRSVTADLVKARAHFPGPSPNTRHASRGRENRR